MHLPEPIPASVHDETFAGVTYHIRGELVPELQIEIGGQAVMFEHHVLLWKETQLNIELRKLPGGGQAQDRGPRVLRHPHLGLRADRLLARLARASACRCTCARARGWTCASTSSSPRPTTSTTASNASRACRTCCSGGSGFFMDKFRATDGDALVWLHGHGNVFLVELDAGEQLDVEAGAWLYKDPSGEAGGGHDGPEDGHLRRRRQAHLEPLHRPGPPGDPDAVHRPAGGRGASATPRPRPPAALAGALIGGLMRG